MLSNEESLLRSELSGSLRLAKSDTALGTRHDEKLPRMPYQTDQIDIAAIGTELDDICMLYNKWKHRRVTRNWYSHCQSGCPKPKILWYLKPGIVRNFFRCSLRYVRAEISVVYVHVT